MKIYLIDSDYIEKNLYKLTGRYFTSITDITDNEFKKIAEKYGIIYDINEFTREWNENMCDNYSPIENYIRIL